MAVARSGRPIVGGCSAGTEAHEAAHLTTLEIVPQKKDHSIHFTQDAREYGEVPRPPRRRSAAMIDIIIMVQTTRIRTGSGV